MVNIVRHHRVNSISEKKNQKAKKEHTKSHAHNYYPFYELIVFHYSSSKNIKRRVTWIGHREREIR